VRDSRPGGWSREGGPEAVDEDLDGFEAACGACEDELLRWGEVPEAEGVIRFGSFARVAAGRSVNGWVLDTGCRRSAHKTRLLGRILQGHRRCRGCER
jgi:hypothetical protein